MGIPWNYGDHGILRVDVWHIKEYAGGGEGVF
jgi:hypothetical protein